jgi:type I site-specific restriction endonuclease
MSAESGKDLNAGQIGKALEVDGVMHQIAAPLVELSKGRQTIVFTPSIASAEHLADVLRGYNVTVRSVSGETAHLERVGALAGYQLGRIQYITNCAVLTEGFDAPETSCVAIVRPTKSRALYAQMIGRGTRIAPGKTDCLVLDFVPSQAGKHKLVTPFDVLGGKDIDDETIKEARKFSDAGMTAQDALEAAESAKAERQEAERLRAEMKANRVKVQAEYKLRSIDPFGVCSPADLDGPLMKSATASRLASRNITLPPHTTEAAALKIEQEAKVRAMRNQATINQAKVLARHGLRTDMTKREASTILDALSNNGWKVPEPIWQMWRKAS